MALNAAPTLKSCKTLTLIGANKPMDETLFPYQVVGAQFLASKEHALLADEMGLGKSAQAVVACDQLNAQAILIICPANLRVNWSREFTRFSNQTRPVNLLLTKADKPIPHAVNVVSYDLVAINDDLKKTLIKMRWDVLILDEAHYLKERTAKRTKAIYGFRQWPGIQSSAERVWRLTGTPMPNNASELYTHLKSADLEHRNYWDYVFEFCDGFDSGYGYNITGTKNVPKLKRLLGQMMLRRKKEEVMQELPPIRFQEITVPRSKVDLDPWFLENWYPLPGKQGQFVRELEEMDKSLKQTILTVKKGAQTRYKDQVAVLESYATATSTLRRYIGLAKMPSVLAILEEELKEKTIDKLVIFAVHSQVIEQARHHLRKFGVVTLYGGTPTKKRQDNIDLFQHDPATRVFIGNIQAAGTGITLTAAKEVAFLEQSWVPAENAQAAMRCHRLGQMRPVRVRFFCCEGSVDEEVSRILIKKTRDIATVLD